MPFQITAATFALALVATLSVAGCSTHREVTPTIQSASRPDIGLETPVIASVFDGRTSQKDDDAASDLQAELSRIYGPAFEWKNYFAETPPGRGAIRIRLVELGAKFGSRLISTTTFVNSVESARISAVGTWGPVVGAVASQQSVLASSFAGEGRWNGAAWIDLEVEDRRGDEPIQFVLPIAAEHQESNMLGYTSGDRAARMAWDQVAAQLTRAIDTILRSLREA